MTPTVILENPQQFIALYLGFVTLVVGSGGITVHRHTRGTLNRRLPIFGFSRLCISRKRAHD